ncbi:MAG: tRNA (N6-isopentenyl adenosine(37)-C2)-methylthiotransferase MiaB [Clostridia bacterium]|nr:tRNA (N6-isopentenyl adenosine(37)-C2)-methylthiotransferase MiaB [Clostridia bacterium]
MDEIREDKTEVMRYRDRLLSDGVIRKYSDAVIKVRAIVSGEHLGYYVRTFGCQQNEADSERIAGMAESMGYEKRENPEDASLIVINTCAVRDHAEKKALSVTGQLKKIKQERPGVIIAVCGCMVSHEKRANQIKRSYPYVDFTFGTPDLHMLPELLLSRLEGGRRSFILPPDEPPVSECIPVVRNCRYRAWVSIMFGCNNFCTYCIVPYVRGRERSRRPETIIDEIRGLVADGCREITLLGQNVNSYGRDCSFDCNFAELLRRIDAVEGDFTVRFMTSHPKDATRELIDVIAGSRHIAHQFHLPAQSGSDRILKAMNRRYTCEKYLEIIKYIREKIPDCVITSDFMVGFPGETEEDFAETLKLLSTVEYDMIYSFIYSPRELTPAAEMEQLDEKIKGERLRRMVDLQTLIADKKNSALLGATERVLCVGRSQSDRAVLEGRDYGNKIVLFEGDPGLEGNFVDVEIIDTGAFVMRGKIKESKQEV